ncbi:hypothetical protein NT2_05_00870 [Caenibius tardaugens NBRC 16725]|uniref:Uncharacterized protein n=1 Tax=Caenibius tardaugens NBRC 16725 TaxID=1219035 RepID=U2Y7I3_9SPHN|nr:hypothetical protein [Caenibius tardaugens]AZI36525.1 hypothetical protein EGO55_11645 [Caenibius tardaugens NBRC 16725]GAD49166.1 hypothetical protein NT2_05_00870 [Caenibius tardaugens NBRC 16725]
MITNHNARRAARIDNGFTAPRAPTAAEPTLTVRIQDMTPEQVGFVIELLSRMSVADEDVLLNGAGCRFLAEATASGRA